MTTPYYEDEYVTLYQGDCREITEWLDAHVLVTDPPYGMSFQSGYRKGAKLDKIAGDEDTTIRDAALALWGTRPGLAFGRWSIPAPAGEKQRLIWGKSRTPGMGDLRIPWGTAHEDIHVLGDGWNVAGTGEKRTGSVITTAVNASGAAGDASKYGHPTPKPVALMEYLIARTPPGVIADPFAGSGATLVAARNLGRRAVGVELEEKYCEVIVSRLAQQAFDFSGLGGDAA